MKTLKKWFKLLIFLLILYSLVFNIAEGIDSHHVALSRSVDSRDFHAVYKIGAEIIPQDSSSAFMTVFVDVKKSASTMVVSILDKDHKTVLYTKTMDVSSYSPHDILARGFPFFISRYMVPAGSSFTQVLKEEDTCCGKTVVINKIKTVMGVMFEKHYDLVFTPDKYDYRPALKVWGIEKLPDGRERRFVAFFDKETGLLMQMLGQENGYLSATFPVPVSHMLIKAAVAKHVIADEDSVVVVGDTFELEESSVPLTPVNYMAVTLFYINHYSSILWLILTVLFIIDLVKRVGIKIYDKEPKKDLKDKVDITVT